MIALEFREMVNDLLSIEREISNDGIYTGITPNVLKGGEWELALIELESVIEGSPSLKSKYRERLLRIREFLGNPENPYHLD